MSAERKNNAPWHDQKWQHKPHRRYQCRCNRASCRARVTRRKHPDDYIVEKWAKCPTCGKGKLIVDWYRMWPGNSAKDRGEPCGCNGRPHDRPMKHRKGQRGCLFGPPPDEVYFH